jgi:predicted dehydrogenase
MLASGPETTRSWCSPPGTRRRAGGSCVLYGPSGSLTYRPPADPPSAAAELAAAAATIRREFAEAVAGGVSPPLDVHRGLHLQRLLDAATRSLA